MTANAILKGEINGQKTFSVYFGQSFEPSANPVASKVSLGQRDVYQVSSISDLDSVPDSFETSDLVNAFDRYFHDGVSNVSVHKIVNLVFILRKLVSRKRLGGARGGVTNLL